MPIFFLPFLHQEAHIRSYIQKVSKYIYNYGNIIGDTMQRISVRVRRDQRLANPVPTLEPFYPLAYSIKRMRYAL